MMMSHPHTPKKRAAVLDPPYIEEGRTSDDKKTPQKRLKTGTSISTTLKLNARADIHNILVIGNPSLSVKCDVCIVSGMTDEMDVIEYSHVVPRTTRPATLDKCEWCWGMDYYTLNLDTRKNLQSLRVNLHRLFDMPTTGWLWVPTDLGVLLQFVNTYKFYEEKTKFSYRLAATPEMSNRHISTYDPSLKPTDSAAFKRHFYPFNTLPEFEFNVHPHFVIFNTGFRLEQIFGRGTVIDSGELKDYFKLPTSVLSSSLKSCYDLYCIWMSASPPEAFLHSENCHWDDQDAARKPVGTSSSRRTRAGARSAGRNSGNTNPNPLGGSGSSTVDRETMPLGTDAPDDFVDTELVMPDDSISLLLGEDGDAQSHEMKEEEEEEEDHEAFFRGVKRWAEDVYETTEDGASDDGDNSSGSDTSSYNTTLVGNTPPRKYGELEDVTMTDASLKTGLMDIHQPPIFHSFWDTY
ncbi:hypothetical protein EYR36_011857 [Pleurotus pulmonarius]|nr:hypothetical protein EYR36_011857 [Pleurotus pulmonarius]